MPDAQPAPVGGPLPRGHLLALNRSFRRTLEAENKSPRTIEAYTDAVRLLATYCQAHGHPALASVLERRHVQAFIADQLTRWKPATAHNRYRGLHAFFKWAVAEGDLQASPMDGMKPPQLPEQPVEVVRPEHLARLLRPARGGTLPAAATPPAHRLGAGQGSTASGAADRPQDRPGTGPLPAGPRVPPAGPPGAALDRPAATDP